MKHEVYEALKRFEKEVKEIIPGAEAKVVENFDDSDACLKVVVPTVNFEIIQKLTKLELKIEKETGVTLTSLPTTNENETESRKKDEVRRA